MDIHGGNIYKYNKNLLDYSSNINPLGVPKNLKKAIKNNIHLLEKYPDINYNLLIKSISDYNDLSENNIIVGNGATEILFLYMKNLCPKKVLIVSPTFAEYERALKSINCEIDYFKLDEVQVNNKNFFDLNIEKLLLSLDSIDLVIICNPNNPTGHFTDFNKMKILNNELKKRNIKLFVDESFLEFLDNWQKISMANIKSKNIFVLRALTKYFALPGIRLGYGISYDENLIKSITDIREPWSVNSFADLAGQIILKDEKYIKKTEIWIRKERKYFLNELKKIEHLKVYETTTNFILIKLRNLKSEILLNEMIELGILIRNANNFKCLNGEFIRIAIKDRSRNKEFIKIINLAINKINKGPSQN